MNQAQTLQAVTQELEPKWDKARELYAQLELDEAAKLMWEVVERVPTHAQSLGFLAKIYVRQKKYNEAEVFVRRSLKQEKIPEVEELLAFILMYKGEFAEAEKLTKSIAKHADQNPSLLLIHLDCLFRQGKYAEALKYIQTTKHKKLAADFKDTHRFSWQLRAMLLAWLTQDVELLAEQLENPVEHAIFESNEVNFGYRLLHVYQDYVSKLSQWRAEKKPWQPPAEGSQPIYVVGESHCLSPHGETINLHDKDMHLESRLAIGIKAFHLAKTQTNEQVTAFEALLKGLPKGSHVIVVAGEIDCRQDEGILPNLHKYESLEQGVFDIVKGYLTRLAQYQAQFGHKIAVCGVPAPHFETRRIPSKEGWVNFLEIIRVFNLSLRSLCKEMNLPFLDVYGMTVEPGRKVSAGMLHIDTNHLLPTVIPAAMRDIPESFFE